MAKDAKGHGSDAHSSGVAEVGKQPLQPAESHQSQELRLFGDNDSNLYHQSFVPVVNNLGKKMDKGVYDPQKATTLWGYHADRAAQSYAKQMGGAPWHQQFPPAVRREAAAAWERQTAPAIKRGEYK